MMTRVQFKILIFLFSCLTFGSSELPKDKRIIIVGAGGAGMSALSKLIENGYTNVTLLEAEDRIGGRINTIPFGSSVIDFGAQWVHDGKGNLIFDMIDGHNLLGEDPPSLYSGDQISSEKEEVSDYRELLEICDDIFRHNDDCKKIPLQPYGEYFIDALDKQLNTTKYQHITKQNKEDFIRQYEKIVTQEFSSDSWFKMSTSFCSELYQHPGTWMLQNWKDKGFKTVFDFITKKLPDPSKDLKVESRILFNKEVSEIDYRKADSGEIIVKCSDKSVYEASHVIVTVSLGVLKAQHKTMFLPPLPDFKVNSIENLDFGTLDKIALEFSAPFWPSEWEGFSLIWTEKGLADIKNTKFEWTKGIFGFYRVGYQPSVLFGWIVGPEARAMETLSDEQVLEGVMFVFERFLTGKFNYTKPIRTLPSRWNSNPHFRGSYSSRTLESDKKFASAYNLSVPLNNTDGLPVIMFAGEATNPEYYTLSHGAIGSGFREAERLMKSSSTSVLPVFVLMVALSMMTVFL